jgi:23S rRNA (uridine2552-2'-O)-methyltransferase
VSGRGGKGARSSPRSGLRGAGARLAAAKGRGASSARWLVRQLKDSYVAAAKRRGYRSRAAFKLIELDDRFRFLAPGGRVVDLGAAPGGWTQVAAERTGASGRVVAVDAREMAPVAGAVTVACDVFDREAPGRIAAALGGPADAVLSDMAAAATGHAATDHLRAMALAEAALDIAEGTLAEGGAFVAKLLQGGGERDLRRRLERRFARVRFAKPPASRSESRETYAVALGFRGQA